MPIREVIAIWGPTIPASIPTIETIANVRMPTSLLDHSRSSPTSMPIPTATAIFSAMGVGGNRSVSGPYMQQIPVSLTSYLGRSLPCLPDRKFFCSSIAFSVIRDSVRKMRHIKSTMICVGGRRSHFYASRFMYKESENSCDVRFSEL